LWQKSRRGVIFFNGKGKTLSPLCLGRVLPFKEAGASLPVVPNMDG